MICAVDLIEECDSALAANTHRVTSLCFDFKEFRAVTNADKFPMVPPCTNTPPEVLGIPAISINHLSA